MTERLRPKGHGTKPGQHYHWDESTSIPHGTWTGKPHPPDHVDHGWLEEWQRNTAAVGQDATVDGVTGELKEGPGHVRTVSARPPGGYPLGDVERKCYPRQRPGMQRERAVKTCMLPQGCSGAALSAPGGLAERPGFISVAWGRACRG